MRPARHLIVFAKAPVLGRVKSRLGRDIGPVAATSFYRRNLDAVLRRLAADGRWRCTLALAPDRAMGGPRFWPPGFTPLPQGEGDIGRRMDRALRSAPPGPAVLIGADVPGIARHHIAEAFRALGHHDAAFGPAADGGYWLVGARRSPVMPDLFSGVRWSSHHTLADSLQRARRRNLKVALLQTLDDIDDGEAYRRWLQGRG